MKTFSWMIVALFLSSGCFADYLELPISPVHGGTGVNTSASTGCALVSAGTWSIPSLSSCFASFYQTVATTGGDLIVGGTSGTPTRVAAGTSGYVFISNGPGSAPSWSAASGVTTANVTSASAGNERIERAQVSSLCTSTPCTIASQSGSWLTSISRLATGSYALNITSGEFSGAPSCQIMPGGAGSGPEVANEVGTSTSTSFPFIVAKTTDGSSQDASFYVICQGPH